MSRECTLNNGHLHSPFFLFLRAPGQVSDFALLETLGLHDFVRCPLRADTKSPHIYFTEDEAWVHIADDWLYSLWHKGADKVADALHQRWPDFGLFTCSVGDIDRSFDFTYYNAGQMVRRFVVESRFSNPDRRTVKEDFGEPFPDEVEMDFVQDEQEYVLSLANGLGVRVEHQLDQIRCYSKQAP